MSGDNNINRYRFSNGNPVYSGKISKYKGKALDKPHNFYIRPLNIRDCSAMADLSTCIYDNLSAGQECFIHKHDRKYYREIFENQNNENVKYIGVFVGKNLIAMSYFNIIENEKDLQPELPNHRLDIFSNNRGVGKVKVAAFGADSVHPDFRGNHLNTVMVEYRENFARSFEATDFVSIIDRRNVWNMTPYFANGFNMFASSVDPADGGKISLLHKPGRENIEHNDNEFEKMSYENLNAIDKMFYMKRIGIAYDKESGSIVFAKTDYYADLRRQQGNNLMVIMQRKKDAARI